jgi:3-dehydroquinate dehydratase/shikimate dehydrogenase
MDVELAAYQRSANLRQKVGLAVQHERQVRDLSTSLILSSHDFRGRPADLLQRIEAMTNEPACAVVKVAWQARSLRDNLEAFDLLRERRKPMIALCMGQFGLMSRVLAGKFGGLLTFAGDRESTVTAPGQPTIDELVSLYRFKTIGPKTRVYGVIGWPVEHSMSPAIHNAGFAAAEFDGVYLPLPIPPEYEHFKATVGAMIDHPHLDFRGASVTIPHKEHLLRFVRERGGRLDAPCERIGAANTLVIGSAGGMECLNTDGPAAIEALCGGMDIEPAALAGKRAAVLGAGGAARAVMAGLLDHGASVVVFARDHMKAQAMVDDLSSRLRDEQKRRVQLGKADELACGCFHIFINCTPIGMAGSEMADQSPLDVLGGGVDVPLNDEVTVFDTIYAPARTPLIAEAESRGAIVVPGAEMFIRQAAMQFERWTNHQAPRDVFRRHDG